MIKISTPNDVIRYVYNEVSSQESEELKSLLLWDNDLADLIQELSEVKKSVSKIKMEPSDRVINNILNYSKSYSLRTA
jgi:hypothetical protein